MPARRIVLLGEQPIELLGTCPEVGAVLPRSTFTIPPARNAARPLSYADLVTGSVLVSTLPNIGKHACAAQILGLEEQARERSLDARLIHVSADAPAYWSEVDLYHPNLEAAGYSLHGASAASVRGFTRLFGVAVRGQRRIAHGLFALHDGVVLAAEIPHQQMGVPSIGRFLHQAVHRGLPCGVSCGARDPGTVPAVAALARAT